MTSCALRRIVLQHQCFKSLLTYSARRTLLSEAYSCQEAWNQRMKSPILQKVDVGNFGVRISEKFESSGQVSCIDMDLFANKLENIDIIQLDFAQSLFHKFRHTDESILMLPSTPHALIRNLLKFGEYNRIVGILKDKINYGIFLDTFTANILLDTFIEKKMYKEAASIAYDLMLQEDFSHPLNRYLAWYACHQHLTHYEEGQVAEQGEDQQQDEEEEEQYFKVKYIQNPWYDDHFDIKKDSQLLGKTFVAVAREEEAGTLRQSYTLIGWGLYEKIDKGLDLLEELANGKGEGAITQFALDEFKKAVETLPTAEPPEEQKEPGQMTLEDVMPYVTEEQKQDYSNRLQEVLPRLEAHVDKEFDLEATLLSKLHSVIEKITPVDIKDQTETYAEWNQERERHVEEQLAMFRTREKKEDIVRRLLELKKREERLSYFEEKDRITVGMVRAPKVFPLESLGQEEQFVEAPGERTKAKK